MHEHEREHAPASRGAPAVERLRGWTAGHPWAAAAVVFVCAVAPFAGSLRADFVSTDRRAVEDNPVVERGVAGLDPLLERAFRLLQRFFRPFPLDGNCHLVGDCLKHIKVIRSKCLRFI